MKKILLLFVLFLGFSFGAFAASEWQIIAEVQEFVLKESIQESPSWLIYRDDNGHWYWYDDDCDKDTIMIEDDIVFEESGPC